MSSFGTEKPIRFIHMWRIYPENNFMGIFSHLPKLELIILDPLSCPSLVKQNEQCASKWNSHWTSCSDKIHCKLEHIISDNGPFCGGAANALKAFLIEWGKHQIESDIAQKKDRLKNQSIWSSTI